MQEKVVSGFSKYTKQQKLDWIASQFFDNSAEATSDFAMFWQKDPALQQTIDGFSENTISNFVLPFGVAPNFMVNGKVFAIPMVIEESSVVAAASSAAKYWLKRGGFKAEIISTKKLGQVHFTWHGRVERLKLVFDELVIQLKKEAAYLTANMEKRGGGVLDIELKDFSGIEPGYFQLMVSFETCDSMGANFINSVLESYARTLEMFVKNHTLFNEEEKKITIIMAILSNYTPECVVKASVECPLEKLGKGPEDKSAITLAEKFYKAVRIAQIDPYRATTHNKGIMNGVDAVVIATGNDFRAIEASCHTYAARDGQYRSLSDCKIEDGIFKFWLEIPLALGTVGGLTRIHPLAKRSLEMLGNPSAKELMEIVAATGLAQNFAAVRSLVTTGIQKGHMKMHLTNILNHFGANATEEQNAREHFEDKVVSFSAVRGFLEGLRAQQSVAVSMKK